MAQSALAVSAISLAVSFLALFIAWRQFSRDRSDLKIDVEFHVETGKGTAFLVTLVNNGRRAVSVGRVGLRLRSGELVLNPNLINPVILGETESWPVWFLLYDYRERIRSPLDVTHAEAWDTSGRRYTVSCARLRSQIAKEWTSETDWLSKV